MKIKEIKKLSKAEKSNLLKSEAISKSEKIRSLFCAGESIKDIAELLNIRYNFAYNIISNYIIMNDIEIIKEEKINKKAIAIDLYKQNKSIKEIAIELKSNYNYIYKIIKDYKEKELAKEII